MELFKTIGYTLGYALHPQRCVSCDKWLYEDEKVLCISCRHDLSLVDVSYNSHFLDLLFFGRINWTESISLLNFNKKGVAQALIHQLKYKGRQDIGVFLARWLTPMLIENGLFAEIQAVVPVPLHPKKERKRGYNQLTTFGKTLADIYQVPYVDKVLVRAYDHSTQTRLDRFKRWENVKDIFDVREVETLKNKHILLIDDVITTGATLEACVRALSKIEGITLSLLTIAKAA